MTIKILFVAVLATVFVTVVRKITRPRPESLVAMSAAPSSAERAPAASSPAIPKPSDESTPMFRFSSNLFPSRDVHKLGVSLATSLMKTKEFSAARKILEDVVRYEPKNIDLLNNLAYLVGEAGEWDKAEGYLRRALDVSGKCSECHNNLGNVLLKFGKLDEAKVHFEKAIQNEPKYLDAHLNLALALEQLNDWGGALEWYRKSEPLIKDPEIRKMVQLRSTWMEEISQGRRTIASH